MGSKLVRKQRVLKNAQARCLVRIDNPATQGDTTTIRAVTMKGNALLALLVMSLLLLVTVHQASAQSDVIRYYRQGQQLEGQGRYTEATFSYQDALQGNPYYIEAKIGLARCHFEMGNLTLSRETVRSALAQDPKNVDALILLGRIETSMKHFSEAEAALSRAREIEPARLEIRYRLGDLYRAQGKQREAVDLYREMLKANPRDVKAHIYLGILYTELGDLERAGGYYRKAVSLDSHDPLTHLNLARHYYRMGVKNAQSSPQEAGDYFEAGISETHTAIAIMEEDAQVEDSLLLKKEIAGAYDLIGAIEFQQEHYERAIEAFRKASALYDEGYLTWYELGFSLEMLGRDADALKAYETALNRRIDDEIVRFRLENLLLKLYRTDLENPDKLLHANSHFREGRFNLERNLFDKAFFHFKRAVMLDPLDPEKRLALANLYRIRGYDEQYLFELRSIVHDTLDVDTVDLNDRIEIYDSRVRKNLASQWHVRQYEEDEESPYHIPRTRSRIAVLNAFKIDYIRGDFLHRRLSRTLAEMLNLVLNYYEKIEVLPVYTEVFARHEALPELNTDREALEEARRLRADYYITGDAVEREDSLKVHMEIRSAFNGMLLHELTTFYTGNERVFNTVTSLAAALNQFAPLRGRIVRMEGNRALINLGRAHGVERDMTFNILREGGLQVNPETGEYEYDAEEILGELSITRVDEVIAEGTYTYGGLFNRVNVYDLVVLKPPEEKAPDAGR
jgi:tetratricopeptide (TPR) repeat protein